MYFFCTNVVKFRQVLLNCKPAPWLLLCFEVYTNHCSGTFSHFRFSGACIHFDIKFLSLYLNAAWHSVSRATVITHLSTVRKMCLLRNRHGDWHQIVQKATGIPNLHKTVFPFFEFLNLKWVVFIFINRWTWAYFYAGPHYTHQRTSEILPLSG